MLVLLLLLGAFCAPAVQATTAPTQSPTTSINCFATPNTELKNCMRWKACVASGGAQCDNGLGSLGTTLKMNSAGIIGTIPSDDVSKMTALTDMCVHVQLRRAIASFPAYRARTAIHPLFTRAHFLTFGSLPLRSPTLRSLCGDTQVVEQQPARGADPPRGRTDDGAHTDVRARACSAAQSPLSRRTARALRFTCCTRALTSPRPCRFPCALRRHAQFVVTRRDLRSNVITGPIPTEVGLMTALTHMCVHERAPPRNRLFPGVLRAHCDSPAVHARSLPHARVASPALSDATLNLW